MPDPVSITSSVAAGASHAAVKPSTYDSLAQYTLSATKDFEATRRALDPLASTALPPRAQPHAASSIGHSGKGKSDLISESRCGNGQDPPAHLAKEEVPGGHVAIRNRTIA